MERELENDISLRKPEEKEVVARRREVVRRRVEAGRRRLLEESKNQRERVLPRDGSGESRELTTHIHGGHTDSESIDGDMAEECLEAKVTGT